ncbi:hypothetical protein SeMB42_g02383 [Synchytrium endobioticum]|uniref:GSKIP domain-containing protein n=1 Tax=Synchytrium endobioticum TaxID=286115 RepID=A0A507DGY8_9FUNG|nr:hypothetical protein SeLEV6574_g02674 [Synchytrium endobioticum]TPX50100.1 hypothetical protein SeMB42_g02383 [Synchytrium endobioticum]
MELQHQKDPDARHDELIHAVVEYAHGVKSLELLDLDPRKAIASDRVGKPSHPSLRVTTLEDLVLTVQANDSGFLISDVEASDASWTRYKFQIYESMDSLLNDLSPAYRNKFHERIASRLQMLANQED